MFSKSIVTLVITLTVALFACSSTKNVSTGKDRWERLGEKAVDYRVDHDVVNVSKRDGTFKQLRLVVRIGSLNMYRCVVHFDNGGVQEVDLRHTFTKGSASRIIDLKGSYRYIDRISFWYDTKNFSNNKAVLVAWGK